MVNCVCGCLNTDLIEHDYYEVTPEGETRKASGKINLLKCTDCGIIRQDVAISDEEYKKYYEVIYPPNKEGYLAKNYGSDRELAVSRCDEYKISSGKSLLDVGSGSGAFVDECRARGVSAFGCEISKYHYSRNNDFIYFGQFEKLNFPTDYFDIVTCHDVVEHVTNPVEFLDNMFRIVKQGGTCFIDVPRSQSSLAGEHHFKKEHLWYFTVEQLKALLEKMGFLVMDVQFPIESKMVFCSVKSEQDRPIILVPPGIGDSYWSIVKLESFLKREKLGLPDIRVACNREKKFSGHKRAFPFLEMFPFLNASWEVVSNGKERDIWKEAYAERGRTIFKNVLGCDYFISYNGHLRYGEDLQRIDSDLACNWFPDMFVSLEQINFEDYCKEKYGKYIVFYFVFYGTYVFWEREFPVESIIEYVNGLVKITGYTPVFVGALWDSESASIRKIISSVPGSVNLIGKTSVDQLFGVLKGSELVVGYPSGLTLSSATLKCKTLIIWNDYYDRNFSWNCVSPEVRNKTYFIENTKEINIDSLTKSCFTIIRGNKPFIRKEFRPTKRIESYEFTKNSEDSIKEISIACVLKSGGDFTIAHVKNLYNMLAKYVTLPFKFLVLSDLEIKIEGVICFDLIKNLPGWWSKLELFQLSGPVLYFDLDTVIVKNIDPLVRSVGNLKPGEIRMLTPFNLRKRRRGDWASGIMAWRGAFRFILDSIDKPWGKRFMKVLNGDQEYISKILLRNGKTVAPIKYANIVSFKKNCLQGVPKEADIICYHGNPRPEINGRV